MLLIRAKVGTLPVKRYKIKYKRNWPEVGETIRITECEVSGALPIRVRVRDKQWDNATHFIYYVERV